jgi:nicotinamidase-related amidase
MSSFAEAQSVYEKAGIGGAGGLGTKPAIIVVDFSVRFADPEYSLGGDMSAQIAATKGLLDVARSQGVPVLFSTIAFEPADLDKEIWINKLPGLAELIVGSEYVDIDPRLERRPDESVVVKTGASSFFGTNLAGRLTQLGVDTVVVCGATTSGCIRATVVDAMQYQLRVVVPRECVADRHQAPHDATLFDIEAKYGDVVSVDDVHAYLNELAAVAA